MRPHTHPPKGMRAFFIIWIGQILSLLGTAVSNFGLTLWAFDVSGGKATPLTLIGFFFFVPMVAFNPVVGVLVDHANRKVMMMLSDLAAATSTLIVLVLYLTGGLQIWHLYITAFISGTFQGFQWPAYSAALSTMLDKKDYTRANAMLEMVGPASHIFAPMIAGAILGPLGIWITHNLPHIAGRLSGQPGLLGLLVIDVVSAGFAIGTLLFVHIPQPQRSEIGEQAHGHFVQEAIYGFRYILEHPSLLGLQLVFMLGNLFHSLGFSVYAPMILARTNGNELILGSVQTAGAAGAILGGVIIGAWGGFNRRIHGVMLGWALSGVGMVGLGMARGPGLWMPMAVVTTFFGPLINASNQAIWQSKVAPDIQGRVFASRRLIAWLVTPISQLIAGPLADGVLEPAMQSTNALSWLVGSGPGAGMGLQFALGGLLTVLIGLGGYLLPHVCNIEDILPDHDAVIQAAA